MFLDRLIGTATGRLLSNLVSAPLTERSILDEPDPLIIYLFIRLLVRPGIMSIIDKFPLRMSVG